MNSVLVAGELIAAGKYRVDRVIGRGGMGLVVGATHLQLRQQVALKFLLPELADNDELVERFVREARASAQLRGEHVCRVADVGTADNGAPYIVMELLAGQDLASLLQANGPLPVAQVADYMLQMCVGVAEAHALGIVHRDLKPGNLFLTRRPDGAPLIKVLDFGIAKPQRDQTHDLTATSTVLGTPSYMSPEQLRSSRDVDARSDVWSIGVILYELVSGRRPFTGASFADLALRIATDPAPPLGGRIPPGFEAIIRRCLAKDPAQRYRDVAELAQALVVYAGPAGREMASAVWRLLHVARGAALDENSSAPRSRSNGSIRTTLRSATSWLATDASGSKRRGVLAAVAATTLLGVAVTLVLAHGTSAPDIDPSPRDTAGVTAPDAPVDAAPRPVDAAMPPEVAVSTVSTDAGTAGAGDAGSRPSEAGKKAQRKRETPPNPRQPETKPKDFSETPD